jgi:hypothetical protein
LDFVFKEVDEIDYKDRIVEESPKGRFIRVD